MFSRSIATRVARRAALAVSLLTLATAGACTRHHPGQTSTEPAVLVFTNEGLEQADVFAVANGASTRKLATVMAGRTENIRVPADIVQRGGSFSLFVRRLARSGTLNSGPVAIQPGDRLIVRLPMEGRSLFVVPDRS